MADIVNTNQFRNGMHIEHRGSVWRIVEFQHVKPGKGGAFVRTKLKNLESGAVVEDTFRAGEKFPRVHTEVKSVQFLYDDGSDAQNRHSAISRPKVSNSSCPRSILRMSAHSGSCSVSFR